MDNKQKNLAFPQIRINAAAKTLADRNAKLFGFSSISDYVSSLIIADAQIRNKLTGD